MAGYPSDLEPARHRDLEGRRSHPWYRRALMALVAAIPVVALFNVFGQQPSTSRAAGPAATLTVVAPQRLRGGLNYQGRIEVKALRDIQHAQLVLYRGWWEGMSENSIAPDASTQSNQNGGVTLSYGHLSAGQTLTVWAYYQVIPTNVGHRDQSVELDDGTTMLARVNRKVTVLP